VRTVDTLVLNAAQVVTVAAGPPGPARGAAAMNDLGVVERASIAIHRGRVAAIAPTNEVIKAFRAKSRVHADGRTVLPGLVDAHTHPVFARWRDDEFARRCRGESYDQIRAAGGGIVASAEALRTVPEADLVESVRATFDRMLLHGVTVVEAKSGYGLSTDAEVKSLRVLRKAARGWPITAVPTFLGAHAVPREFERDRDGYVRLLCDEMIPRVARERLARFCDVFCDRGAFTPAETARILGAARAHGLAGKVHADELADDRGAEVAASAGAVSADHLGFTGTSGIRALAKAGTIPVLLPTTSVFLGLSKTPRAREMVEAGCAVALASDFNPGSSPTVNLSLSAGLGCSLLGLTPEEAVTAVTRNAAAAVGLSDRSGSIAVGRRADLVLLDAPSYVHLPYRLGTNLVHTVLRGGQVVVEDGRRVESAPRPASSTARTA
jgi:imidazolonepropionase